MLDFEEIKNFDKHIEMSIPDYCGLVGIIESLALEFLHTDGLMVDLGCSSGSLLNRMRAKTSARLLGCDLVDIRSHDGFDFVHGGALSALKALSGVDVITCVFTLQFMSRTERLLLINEIKRHIGCGAVAIIAEKVHIQSSRINAALFRHHLRGKIGAFSSDEVMNKDSDLCGSMLCLDSFEMEKELSGLGGRVDQIWQNCGFKAWIVQ